jgi:hypothetical protein
MKATLVPNEDFGYTNVADDWFEPDSQLGTVDLPFRFGRLLASVGLVSSQCYTSLEREIESSEREDHLLSRLFDSEGGHRQNRVFVTFHTARFYSGMLVVDE